jgi:glycosyltransferase involved in cell wall biosynthesis
MIVKNEEGVLARCLDSLAGIYDELIIVDTGSTDKTKTIARRYTRHVHDFVWNGDFAAARNFSLGFATCEYIYTADADEMVDEENRARFLILKQALLPEVEMVEMAYQNAMEHATTANFKVEYRPKLFRRLRAFTFMDPLHEVLRTEPIVFRSDVSIRHCPAGGHGARDLAHFAHVLKRGAALSDRLAMMYARELFLAGEKEDFSKAKPYFEEILRDETSSANAKRRAACVLSEAAAREGDAAALLHAAAPELVGLPPSEICCALGEYYYNKRDCLLAREWYQAACNAAQPELIAAAGGRLAYIGLSRCLKALGIQEQAAYYANLAKDWQPVE